MGKIQNLIMIVLMLSVANAWGEGFRDDFNRPNGDLGNDWATQTDGTIEVKIVDNEVLIAGEQATDWARSGLSRAVEDETRISFDFKADNSFNVHIRVDDVGSGAYIDVYAWPGGPFSFASSEDGGWPGWTQIAGSEMIAGEYNSLTLEQFGTEFILTLNGTVVGSVTNANLPNIGSVLISCDSAAGTSGSLHIDNVQIGIVHAQTAGAGIASWEAAAAAASPGFISTSVADALYDIGQYGGEQTYEFVVRSNPDETEASMCLIGRRDFGDTQVGLKFDQWNNTGEYGATVFGVVDLYYGIANHPGVDTHLVFVSSEATNTTALYINGALAGSVDSAISLSGLVGIGYGAQGEDGSDVFDNFDGGIFGVAIYDKALSDDEIAAHSNAFFTPTTDVTMSGDIVKGIPDDGDWPGNEHPALAIDDNVNTKYLHFKGDFNPDPGTGGSGLRITPLKGPSVVTGLTLTTANDVPGRDPIAFELSGSNESIDGPYELIVIGDIVDFAGAAAWPRFTKNETPILFDNTMAYSHYQIIFTAIRGPVGGSVNSMQIADIELLRLTYRVVDNFENRIVDTWIPVGGATGLSADRTTVFGGEQSMLFSYNNTSVLPYSEAQRRTFVDPQDWRGLDVVSLYMYGDSNNDPAPVYVRLKDNHETESVVYSPDSNALITDEWTELIFPLEEFRNMDVDLEVIKEVAIGTGFHPKALIHDLSIGLLQSNPPSIGLLQADTCDYCSSYGQALLDDLGLQLAAISSWYSGCVLTGCVFIGGTVEPGAIVKLTTTTPATTCPGAGRYLTFPVRAWNGYTVTATNGQQYFGSVPTLEPGLNVFNIMLP